MRNKTEFEIGETQRISPKTILYHLLKNYGGFALILFVWNFSGKNTKEGLIQLVLILVFGLLASLLNYIFYSFKFTNSDIIVKWGVFAKKERAVPFARIQNVLVKQHFLQKILALATIEIETAGSSGTAEVQIESISVKSAQMIQDIIKQKALVSKDNINDAELSTDKTIDKSNVIFEMNLKDLAVFGAIRLRPVALAFGFWLFTTLQQMLILPDFDDKNFKGYLEGFTDYNAAEIAVLIGIVALVGIFLSWVLDIALTVNQYYKFKLSDENGKLYTRYGLMSSTKLAIPLKKLQAVVISSNPLKRLFRYSSLQVKTAGAGNKTTSGLQTVLPLADNEKAFDIAKILFNFDMPAETYLVSPKYVRRKMVKSIFIIGLPLIYASFSSLYWLSAFLLLLPVYLYFRIRYNNHRYYADNEKIIVSQGAWKLNTIVMPQLKTQAVLLKQTYFQRREGLANLYIESAFGNFSYDIQIIDIEIEKAEALKEQTMNEFKKKKQ